MSWCLFKTEPKEESDHKVWYLVDVTGSLGNEHWESEDCFCRQNSDHDAGQETWE